MFKKQTREWPGRPKGDQSDVGRVGKDTRVDGKREQAEDKQTVFVLRWTGNAAELKKTERNRILPGCSVKEHRDKHQRLGGKRRTGEEEEEPQPVWERLLIHSISHDSAHLFIRVQSTDYRLQATDYNRLQSFRVSVLSRVVWVDQGTGGWRLVATDYLVTAAVTTV